MKKTEAQLARTELELAAIDGTYSYLRYLEYRPKNDNWKKYLSALESQLIYEIKTREFWANNPNYSY